MAKTYYISMDNGETFKRFTKDKARFTRQMWETLTRELYPLGKLVLCRKTLEINILAPKDMREIHTFFVDGGINLEQLWETVEEMWEEIEVNC